jgi:hypothetical protein
MKTTTDRQSTGSSGGASVAATPDPLIMAMLQDHVPLSLLCDLTASHGPLSEEILAEEGQPETPWWKQ